MASASSRSLGMGVPTDGVPKPAMWIPAFRGFGGERYCLPELRTGGGQGMVASVWSVQQLLHPSNVWARLKREAGSDEEFTAGVHYEVTDFEPTHVLFSRVGHTPVVGIRHDTSSELRAQEIYLFERDLTVPPPELEGPPETEWWQSFTTPSTPSTPSTLPDL